MEQFDSERCLKYMKNGTFNLRFPLNWRISAIALERESVILNLKYCDRKHALDNTQSTLISSRINSTCFWSMFAHSSNFHVIQYFLVGWTRYTESKDEILLTFYVYSLEASIDWIWRKLKNFFGVSLRISFRLWYESLFHSSSWYVYECLMSAKKLK